MSGLASFDLAASVASASNHHFLDWINEKLKPLNLKAANISRDLEDGFILLSLVQVIANEPDLQFNRRNQANERLTKPSRVFQNAEILKKWIENQKLELVRTNNTKLLAEVEHIEELHLSVIWTLVQLPKTNESTQTIIEVHIDELYEEFGKELCKEKKYKQSIDIMKKSLVIKLAVYGAQDAQTIRCYHLIGGIHLNQNNFDGAMSVYTELVSEMKKKLGDSHERVAQTLEELVYICIKKERINISMKYIEEAATIRKKTQTHMSLHKFEEDKILRIIKEKKASWSSRTIP